MRNYLNIMQGWQRSVAEGRGTNNVSAGTGSLIPRALQVVCFPRHGPQPSFPRAGLDP